MERLSRLAARGDTFSAFAMRDIPHYHKQYQAEGTGTGVYRGKTYKLFKIKYRLTHDLPPRAVRPGAPAQPPASGDVEVRICTYIRGQQMMTGQIGIHDVVKLCRYVINKSVNYEY